MVLTVRDCLQIGNLKYGTVVAGFEGLDRPIENVTVAEVADAPADLLYGNELVLSALYSIRTDVEKQCDFIRKLHKAGVSGLVIFYPGIYLEDLSDKVINLANELKFPIIVMPKNRIDLAYVDAITPVTEAILEAKKKKYHLISNILNDLYELPQEKRTLKTVMKILGDTLNCNLILYDTLFKPLEWYFSPDYQDLNITEITHHCQQINIDTLLKTIRTQMKLNSNGSSLNIQITPIEIKNNKFGFLVVLSKNDSVPMDPDKLQEIVEIIKIFIQIWGYSSKIRSEFEYVNLLIDGKIKDLNLVYNQDSASIPSEKIDTMIVITFNTEKEKISDNLNIKMLNTIKLLLRAYSLLGFVSHHMDNIVILLSNTSTLKKRKHLLSQIGCQIVKELYNRFKVRTIVGISNIIPNIKEIKDIYREFNDTLLVSKSIYPEKDIFFTQDLFLAKLCLNLMDSTEDYINQLTHIVQPIKIYDKKHNTNYLHTLQVYLLDCNCSLKETAKKLYIHPNTLKYRLRKIEEIFKCNLEEWSERIELTLAIALERVFDRHH